VRFPSRGVLLKDVPGICVPIVPNACYRSLSDGSIVACAGTQIKTVCVPLASLRQFCVPGVLIWARTPLVGTVCAARASFSCKPAVCSLPQFDGVFFCVPTVPAWDQLRLSVCDSAACAGTQVKMICVPRASRITVVGDPGCAPQTDSAADPLNAVLRGAIGRERCSFQFSANQSRTLRSMTPSCCRVVVVNFLAPRGGV